MNRLLPIVPLAAALCACAPQTGVGRSAEACGWFTDITETAGLEFVHASPAPAGFDLPNITGSGAALFDHDGDGDLDAYLINVAAGAAEAPPRNRLFSQGDDGRFDDVTDASGLGDAGYGMGVAVADVDNDGDLDVYLTNVGPDRLYRNRGDGTFEDATASSGIVVEGWSTSAAFLDYDRDGWLDLYLAQYVEYDPGKRCLDSAGRTDYCDPKSFPPATDVLLRNRGDGTFTDVSQRAGILAARGAGLGVAVEDLNDDGLVDVYVANDGWPNQLWINQGDGTFIDAALVRGAAYNLNGVAEAGMGLVAADLDGDLRVDLFLTHLFNETNTFYRNRGAGGFDDATGATGMAGPSLPRTGFGVAALDVELDGDLDLVVANGRVLRGAGEDVDVWASFAERDQLFLNDGSGRFEAVTDQAGLCEPLRVSRGLAVGDIDDDGDADLLFVDVGARARLYRNDAPRSGHWLAVRVVDSRYNREAAGARLTLVAPDASRLRTVARERGYLTSNDGRVRFGIPGDKVDRLDVRWPDGRSETYRVTGVDREITVVRGQGEEIR